MCLLFGLTSRHNLPGSREHAPGNALDSFLQRRLKTLPRTLVLRLLLMIAAPKYMVLILTHYNGTVNCYRECTHHLSIN